MKCVQCPKPATVHLTTVVEGKSLTLHLCEPCANRLEAENLGHPRVAEAISASQSAAALSVGPGSPPTCEGCGKVPSMRVTENRCGVRRDHHLCETCFEERLSDEREKEHYKELVKGPEHLIDVRELMAEADAKVGPLGPENAKAWREWVSERLRRRDPPAK